MTFRAVLPRTVQHLVYYTLLPVIVCELALLPFWFGTRADHLWLPSAQESITCILLPVYLAAVGVAFVWRSGAALSSICILVTAVCLALFLDYSVWGVSTGRFFAPDYETLLFLRAYCEWAFAIALSPPLLALVVRYVSRYARRHA